MIVGPLDGNTVERLKVIVCDGKYQNVDSLEMAFARYEQVPANIANEIKVKYQASLPEENRSFQIHKKKCGTEFRPFHTFLLSAFDLFFCRFWFFCFGAALLLV
ncbi:MAG: hypothetical protein BWY31_03131 [Lentisphaerae bacterium ADurb.Bin242]|nr:MAG: hypothetical protein BWY31_03131 [Lentisphaerae bacterium ADurb.Bin242]